MAVVTISTTVLLINSCGPLPVQTQNQGNSKIITGGFGYKFGDILDKSMILERSLTNNPFAEGYMVKPIINNKDFDYYSVEICMRTKRIYSIAGFKIYNNKAEAMENLYAARSIIEEKYGALIKVADTLNIYAENVQYGPFQIKMMVTSANFTPPKCGFIIIYESEEHKRGCKSFF